MTTVNFTDTFVTYNSEVIKAIFWDANTNNLYVRLRNEEAYGYAGVPRSAYQDFVNAASKGAWWNQQIKKRYSPMIGISRHSWFTQVPDNSAQTTRQNAFSVVSSTPKFTVTFSVNGDLKVTVEADNFADAPDEALAVLESLVDTSNVTLRSVTAVD